MMDTDQLTYHVVVNGKRQYSIWPSHRDLPRGWSVVGVPATRSACLDWIEENWTDIRPAAPAS
jgi:MbtH protein